MYIIITYIKRYKRILIKSVQPAKNRQNVRKILDDCEWGPNPRVLKVSAKANSPIYMLLQLSIFEQTTPK